jgi:hypothetical protein
LGILGILRYFKDIGDIGDIGGECSFFRIRIEGFERKLKDV